MKHTFKDLKTGTIAWLGHKSDQPTVHARFGEIRQDGGRNFHVLNGNWDGVLYPDMTLLVTYTGSKFKVYVVEVES